MNRANINIVSPIGQMPFYFEYIKGTEIMNIPHYYKIRPNDNRIDFYNYLTNIRREQNEWYEDTITNFNTNDFLLNKSQSDIVSAFKGGANDLPSGYIGSTLNIYMPQFSPAIYKNNVYYAIDLSIYICGQQLNIGSYLISPNDNMATPKIVKIQNKEYYEYVQIPIIDPFDITYSDTWKEFRQTVCNDIDGEADEYNNTGSILNISFHVVNRITSEVVTDDFGSDHRISVYRESEVYKGGQNSIKIDNEYSDFMRLYIDTNINENDGKPLTIKTSLKYNGVYNGDLDGFEEYLKETYYLENCHYRMILVIQDDDDVYSFAQINVNNSSQIWGGVPLKDIAVGSTHPFCFDSWQNFKEQMRIKAILSIARNDDPEFETPLFIKSNEIPVTKELFSYLVDSESDITYINLDNIDMNIHNIQAVNKVVQNVINVDRPKDYKSNIVKPVFYRTQDSQSITLHSNVTENICVNLDGYKSKVNTFILRIDGINFIESARVASGVIFKVITGDINTPSGKYYILNENAELVTTGQYNIV